MKRKSNRISSAAALSAGVLLAPPLEAQVQAPAPKAAVEARPAGFIKYATNFWKWKGSLQLAGVLNEVPVFRTQQGELFVVDSLTGNLHFLGNQSFTFGHIKWEYLKLQPSLTIAGVDMQGHVIQETPKGERFYLGPNGDMVFVK